MGLIDDLVALQLIKDENDARTITAGDVRTAFRKLAKIHHPDIKGGDEEKFKKIRGAYERVMAGKENAPAEEVIYRHEQKHEHVVAYSKRPAFNPDADATYSFFSNFGRKIGDINLPGMERLSTRDINALVGGALDVIETQVIDKLPQWQKLLSDNEEAVTKAAKRVDREEAPGQRGSTIAYAVPEMYDRGRELSYKLGERFSREGLRDVNLDMTRGFVAKCISGIIVEDLYHWNTARLGLGPGRPETKALLQ